MDTTQPRDRDRRHPPPDRDPHEPDQDPDFAEEHDSVTLADERPDREDDSPKGLAGQD
jgi:hypothetical protein